MEDLTQRHKGTENGRGRSPSAPQGRAGTPCPPDSPHAPWPRVKLGEVAEVTAGNSAPQGDELFKEGIYPFVRTSDVGAIHFGTIFTSRDKLNDNGIKGLRLFPKGSILFPKSGASTFLNHRVMLGFDSYVVSHLAVIIPQCQIDRSFLLRFLATVDAHDLMQDANYPALRASEISQIEIPLPPLPEQRAIVAKLERELAAVDAMEKKFEEMEKTAETGFKAELKEAFEALEAGATPGNGTDGTNGTTATGTNATAVKRDGSAARRSASVAAVASVSCPSSPSGPSSPSQPPPPPAPCRRVKLGEVCENLDYKRVPITKSDRKAGEYPYYGASGIVDYVADYIFDGDYLLVSEDGANLEARTTPIAFSVSGKIWVNNHAHILRFAEKSNQHFVEYFIAATDISGLITGAAQPKLTQKALNEIELPYPPLSTQRAIVARLDAARVRKEKLVAAARKGAETAGLLRKALLKEAFE